MADQADLLEQLGPEERRSLVGEIRDELDPELLTHLDETVRAEVLEILSPEEVGAAIVQLETDDAVELLEDLDEEEQTALLEVLPMPERAAVEQGLTYPEDSAGRLMQRQLVAAPEFWTVGQTIDYLRVDDALPDDFYDIYIVDPKFLPGRLDPAVPHPQEQARRPSERAGDEGAAHRPGRDGPGGGRLSLQPV